MEHVGYTNKIKTTAEGAMHRDFDIFEVLPDGSQLWRMCAHGPDNALDILKRLGSQTANECYAMNIQTREIVGRINSNARHPDQEPAT